MIESEAQIAGRLAIAALVGLAAGLEREWSGHTSGPDARFAGIRTFFLLGLLGGTVGVLADFSYSVVAAALALGAAAFCVCAYAVATRRVTATVDGTTEAAALTIVGLGVLAGTGRTGVAAGAGALVVLMLSEKARLHWLVRQLSEPELRAGVEFAVLAVVILPLVPLGPYFGDGAFALKPRALWMIVLLISGLNFAGFIARRAVGVNRGWGLAGALGGVVSSTVVTLGFSRQSRVDGQAGAPLARGVVAACTVLVPRVLIMSALLNREVALALWPLLLPIFVAGVLFVAVGWRDKADADRVVAPEHENPLGLWTAMRMAVAFQIAMIVIALVRQTWGTPGLYATATALGFTDVDALTVSMSRAEANLIPVLAAKAIAIGILSNTFLKIILVLTLGRSSYRRRAFIGLVALAGGSVVGFLFA
ncbi:MAG: MgtC/SapB family protein [bacterium]